MTTDSIVIGLRWWSYGYLRGFWGWNVRYKHRGFIIVDKVKKDIGGGFFMDDYLMEKSI